MKKIRRPFAALLDRRYFPALLIVLALAVGMLLPQAVLAVQGVHLEKTDTLLPTGISVGRQSSETAKLDILTRFYKAMENGSGDEIELSRGRYMTAEQVLERVTELKTIADAAGLPFEMPPDNIQSTSGLQCPAHRHTGAGRFQRRIQHDLVDSMGRTAVLGKE